MSAPHNVISIGHEHLTSASDDQAELARRPDKRFATAQARMALFGGSLYRIEDDRGRETFVVSRWNLVRELPTLTAVENWLDQVEGRGR